MEIDIISLFPNYFKGPFEESIIKRAQQKGLVQLRHTDLRTFGVGKHKKVDDRPYGGGPGMVLKPEPLAAAIDSVRKPQSYAIYLSAQGEVLTQAKCRELAGLPHLILVAGHYEGIDERIIKSEFHAEISIGKFVLTSGSAAILVLVDALVRLVPGVLGNSLSAQMDSFEEPDVVDYPHYTRPEEFKGERVPPILLGGDHQKIAKFRREAALKKSAYRHCEGEKNDR